jgi:hypothetical protein
MSYIVPEEYKAACLNLLEQTDYAVLSDVQLVLTNKDEIKAFRNTVRNEMLGLSTLYGLDKNLLPTVPKAVWAAKLPEEV